MLKISHRVWAVWGFLFCVLALSSAVYLQISKNWFPCPLCILQRYAYVLAALGFLCCAFSQGRSGLFSALKFLTLLAVLGGAGAAFYHVWVLAHPRQTCGIDPLQTSLNALPWVQWWPELFESDGFCSDPYPPLFGLHLPMWSGLGFVALAVLVLLMRKSARRWRQVFMSSV